MSDGRRGEAEGGLRDDETSGPLAWFARRPVVVNLIFAFFIVAGLLSLTRVRLAVFPDIEPDVVSVEVTYPGATPADVEDGILTRIEDAVDGIEGIDEVKTTAAEGAGFATIELTGWVDNQQALDDIKAAIDRIDDFPQRAEEPIVTEPPDRRLVLGVALTAADDTIGRDTLYEVAKDVKDRLARSGTISEVRITGVPPYEISIEVDRARLRRYGLTFEDVARSVDRSSLDLPAGTLETVGDDVLVRTTGQAYTAEEFAALPVIMGEGGATLRVRDVARVIDGFRDTDFAVTFDGRPAVLLSVYRIGREGALRVRSTVDQFLKDQAGSLPPGVEAVVYNDRSQPLRSRIRLLLKNAVIGGGLLLIVLGLFLRLRLALWVAAGMFMSFCGAFVFLPFFDIAVHQISLYGFILVLGIVVDDAIVIGENIYRRHEEGEPWAVAAVRGVREVAAPVIITVTSTILAFAPLLFVRGDIGKILFSLPVVVIVVLALSMVEALFLLPGHLGHGGDGNGGGNKFSRGFAKVRDKIGGGLTKLADGPYAKLLALAVRWRYVTAATAAGLMVVTIGYVGGGLIEWSFFPDVNSSRLVASLEMPPGTPAEQTRRAVDHIAAAAAELNEEVADENNGQSGGGGGGGEAAGPILHTQVAVGGRPYLSQEQQAGQGPVPQNPRYGEVLLELKDAPDRSIEADVLADRLREKVGAIPGARTLTISASLFTAGEPINVRLAADDLDMLQDAALALKRELETYKGVTEIADSLVEGKPELEITGVTPAGRALGFDRQSVASQARAAFFGVEAERVQRGRDEVRVYVRLPESDQDSIDDAADLFLRSGDQRAPLSEVADYRLGDGLSAITRANRQRVINVTADVDPEVTNARAINGVLTGQFLPDLAEKYPGLSFTLEGQNEEQQQSLRSLALGLLVAVIAVYTLLAGQFRSYVQPLIVLLAIPLGVVGAVWGHVLVSAVPFLPRIDLTFMSVFGVVALAGVVVNDALILIDLVNRRRVEDGQGVEEAILSGARGRFRPIVLTTLTTFLALAPMILETSPQARFLIPTAISLGFGVLFASSITLLLVPAAYRIVEDGRALFRPVTPGAARLPGRTAGAAA